MAHLDSRDQGAYIPGGETRLQSAERCVMRSLGARLSSGGKINPRWRRGRASGTSGSELPFKPSFASVNDELCSDDDSESEFTIAGQYDSHVDIHTISSSIITAKNLVSFLQTLREGNILNGDILELALEAMLDESKSILKEEFCNTYYV